MLQQRFGLFPGRSPLLGESLLFSLPAGTKMFQFPAFASLIYIVIITLQVIGLSHSEIPGSKVICTYPRLIAAYHVLHRLREPRHPPCALICFRQYQGRFITCLDCSYFQLLIFFLLQSTVLLVSICQRTHARFELSLTDYACAASISILTDKVENNGFEPLTPCLQSRCSSQLS